MPHLGEMSLAARRCRSEAREAIILTRSVAICAAALLIEGSIGYPTALYRTAGHPVGWVGALIARLDGRLNLANDPPRRRRRNGALAMAAVVALCGGTGALAQALSFAVLPPALALLVVAALASSCFAQRSLDTHVAAVAEALRDGGVPAGRQAVAMIVGRDVSRLDEAGIARAAIESLAENFSDGIVAPSVWLALLGLPGGAIYKAINTADSMIAHRTPRHEAFGFAAAKIDDAVNWPAARLAALWLVLAALATPGASARGAWRIMRRDARGHASPNAGWPESAMAGALGIVLGGPRTYAGRTVADATMGDGTAPVEAATIALALNLYRRACGLNIALLAGLALLIAPWR